MNNPGKGNGTRPPGQLAQVKPPWPQPPGGAPQGSSPVAEVPDWVLKVEKPRSTRLDPQAGHAGGSASSWP